MITLLTNYKRDGSIYQNLFCLKAVYDSNGLYRFSISMQIECPRGEEVYSHQLRAKIMSLDRFLKYLPTQVMLQSNAAATFYATMAVKMSGEANESVLVDKHLMYTRALEQERVDLQSYKRLGRFKPTGRELCPPSLANLNYDCVIFSFTKIMWLCRPLEAMKGIVSDPIGREMFQTFCDITSVVYKHQFQYCCLYDDIAKMKVGELVVPRF